ncbi:MAG: exodeoxyribonuclease VII small subunit [candidate division FCPU426 bacterium]
MRKKSQTAAAKPAPPSFEKALARLEEIVSQLESAEVPLEKALAWYEEGVGLARMCAEQLKHAERRVELLEDTGQKLVSRPFADPESGDGTEEDEDEEDEEDETDEEEDSSEGQEDQESLF